MKSALRILLLFVIAVSLTACVSGQQKRIRTNADYKKVWNACLDTVSDVKYSISSTDKSSGLIIADRPVYGGVFHLNIQLFKALNSTDISVKFIPPPDALDGKGTADLYISALKMKIPDLKYVDSNTAPADVKYSDATTSHQSNTSTNISVDLSNQSPKKVVKQTENASLTSPSSMVVTSSNAKLRKTPSKSAGIIKTLKKGAGVNVIKQKGEWFMVEITGGEVGWCHKSILRTKD